MKKTVTPFLTLFTITFLFIVGFSCCAVAQSISFVRVYDLHGKKINKGVVISVNDSLLQIVSQDDQVNIPVSKIGFIKTKRAGGNNVLTGSIIAASAFAILGVVTADPDAFIGYSAGEGAAAGVLIGAPLGAAIGGLTILWKNSKTYIINGDLMQWKAFQHAASHN